MFNSFHLLFTDCWNITKGNKIQKLHNWGEIYKVEFDLSIETRVPSGTKNAYNFIAPNTRIPALWINNNYLSFRSSVNGDGDYSTDVNYEIGKTYQIVQHQFIENGKYWYEIIIDGVSILKMENTQPTSYSSVTVFASDNPHDPFSSDLGSICNIKIQQGEG